MGVLPDHTIRRLCVGTRESPIETMIDPYNEEQLQPASYDVLLGTSFRIFKTHSTPLVDIGDPSTYADLTEIVEIEDGQGIVLHPGEFILGHTHEIVDIPHDLVSRIEGKSSLGRLGIIVHATAGYIDPGFHGAVTLEMTNLTRVATMLRPGMAIAQLSFLRMESEPDHPYAGRYQGDMAVAPSRYGMELTPLDP